MLEIRFTPNDKVKTTQFKSVLRGWHTLATPLRETESISWCIAVLKYEQKHADRLMIENRIKVKITQLVKIQIKEWIEEELRNV